MNPPFTGRDRWLVGTGALCALLGAVTLGLRSGPTTRPASAQPADLAWLESQSMLHQARQSATTVSGRSVQWRHPYGEPQPRQAVRKGSVWLLDYPGSVIPPAGQSVLAAWGEPRLWDALRNLGIDLLHTGPLNRAGGIEGKRFTPTADGWFDPVSLDLDPDLGSEAEFARMVATAGKRGGGIAGDLVPLHTGTGADFHLALRAYKDYPGMFTLVEIDPADWGLLPEVRNPWRFERIAIPAARALTRKGYLPGTIHSNDAARGAGDWSGWSASGEVRGTDGKVRRWAYLHSFKPTQPTLNWLDPSFAAQRAISGGIVRNIHQRGTRVLRLDAVPFLGIELKPATTDALHYQHPLSVSATNELAMLIRKLGGFSFHELNVPLRTLKAFTRNGPDLSYDFFTRAQYLHALVAEDAGPLRLSFRWLLEAGIQPLGLVHDLQNHDEITFQLIEPEHRKTEQWKVNGKSMTGQQLRDNMLETMRSRVAGPAAPYNKFYRPERDGVATTFAGFIAPALGVANPYAATPEQVALIRRGHLLLAAANALQPGVFGLSTWDLVGALPVPEEAVQERTGDGDYRWVNRGAVDLMGANSTASASPFGLPRARALYGSLPQQLASANSFCSGLQKLLGVRRQARVAEGELLTVPEPHSPGTCLLALRLPDHPLALTALNFSRREQEENINVRDLVDKKVSVPTGQRWLDLMTGKEVGKVDATGRLRFHLPGLSGTLLVPAPVRP